jgi:hypothetical protein
LSLLDAVVSKLRSIDGIIEVRTLTANEKDMILRLEEEAFANVSVGLKVVNKGAEEVLKREFVVAINHSSSLRHPSKPLLVIALDDKIVGEEVWNEEQLKLHKQDPNAILMGSGFVIFRDKLIAARGKNLAVILGAQAFRELETVKGVCEVLSATISSNTDTYIKRNAGWDTTIPDRGTVLIGFNSCR